MEITPMVSMEAVSSEAHRHRARTNDRIASAPPHAPRDADRHDLRGSPRLHARETQQHVKVPCSGLEPVDVEAVQGIDAFHSTARKAGHEPSRQQWGGETSSKMKSGERF